MVGLLLSLLGVSVGSAQGESEASSALSSSSAPAAGQCILKTDLPANMIAKCTEAMAKDDKNLLEGCCQEH